MGRKVSVDIEKIHSGTPLVFRSDSREELGKVLGILLKYNIPHRIINNGLGWKTITTITDVCTKCNGTGKS